MVKSEAKGRAVVSNRAIAGRLRLAREEAGLTKADVADRLGITRQGYGPYEEGRHAFSLPEVQQLSRILGYTVEWFLDMGCEQGLSREDEEILSLFRAIGSPDLRRTAIEQLRLITTVKWPEDPQ